MRRTLFALFIPAFLMASAISAEASKINKYFHESFDVQQGFILHLQQGDGNVTITPWDQDVLDVEVRYRAEYQTVGIGGKLEFDVEFKKTGDVIHVISKEECSGSIGFHSHKSYENTYTIHAPEYLELNLDGEDGDVDVENWQGNINCTLEDGDVILQDIFSERTNVNLEDGDLRIDGLEGNLLVDGEDGDMVLEDAKIEKCRIRLGDGNLIIKRSQGEFEINVGDGDVSLDQVRAGMLDIETEDGEVEVDLLKTEGIDLNIRTGDGNVTVDLEPGISAAFSIDTDEGRIRTDLPGSENFKKGRHQISGEIHGGKGRIRISTVDGNVVLRESR